MTPNEFIAKWKNIELTESAAAQSQFIDLCRLLDEPTPAEADPRGTWYAFEKGALKTGGGDGWADVWKRGCFAWEYKGRGKNLDAAFAELQRYAIALENPPLLIVSDMERFRIHTNWTNTIQKVYDIPIEELVDDRRRRVLKWAFSETEVEQLKPDKTRQELTEEVAAGFAQLAQRLRERGHEPGAVAHFVNRLVFCMFAEDVGLLPHKMFTRMLEASVRKPDDFEVHAGQLFAAMQKGGPVGFEHVEWFNGGLFDDDRTLPLQEDDIKRTLEVARLDWSNIDPSIMGTLFERGLDPDKRSQLGAHYTDRDKIMLIVNPVIVEPLTLEWEGTKAKIETLMERHRTHSAKGEKTKAYNEAQALHRAFIDKLKNFRVLDPACGSGNFLYLSLLALKDLEHRANLDAEMLGLPREFPGVGPQCVKGIEINPFAAELARVSVWIGEIQWMKRNGFDAARNPILRPLETIECRDAILNPDATEAEWPAVDAIVGNPPFLGGNVMKRILGEDAKKIRRVYSAHVPAKADLVCHWFYKAEKQVVAGAASIVGLVGTTSIKSGASKACALDRIVKDGNIIFSAYSNQEWTVEGAQVRVAIVCWARSDNPVTRSSRLDGQQVDRIMPNLGGAHGRLELDPTSAVPLRENLGIAFDGFYPVGRFQVPGRLAREWLEMPLNPNGRPNSDVLKPHLNGRELIGRSKDTWIVDFGMELDEAKASLYEAPFDYVRRVVKPERDRNNRTTRRERWWLFGELSPGLRSGIASLKRFLATPKIARRRIFVWLPSSVSPNAKVQVFVRADDAFFGILQSHYHWIWTLALGSRHGVGDDNTYNATRVFETFPFPEGLGPDLPAVKYEEDPRAVAIANAVRNLNELREAWLNPPDLIERLPEVVSGYPDRIMPKDDKAAAVLKRRTLTNLYHERPAWLDHAHRTLDEAVAAAYGWPADLSDEEILERLFRLNQERAAA